MTVARMLKASAKPMSTARPLNYMSSIIDVRKKAIIAFVVMSRIFLIASGDCFPNLRSAITHDSQFDKSRFNSVLQFRNPRSHRNWFSVLCSSAPICGASEAALNPQTSVKKRVDDPLFL